MRAGSKQARFLDPTPRISSSARRFEGGIPAKVNPAFGGDHSMPADGNSIARVATTVRKETVALDIGQRPALKASPGLFRWSPDSCALTYAVTEKGVANVWIWPLDGARHGKGRSSPPAGFSTSRGLASMSWPSRAAPTQAMRS